MYIFVKREYAFIPKCVYIDYFKITAFLKKSLPQLLVNFKIP